LQNACNLLEIGDEAGHFFVTGIFIGGAQDRRGVHGGGDVGRARGLDEFAAMLGDAKIFAEQGLGRGGAQTNYYLGVDGGDFCIEPGAASGDFRGVGFFVDAAFAAGLLLEMFDGVGDVNFFAVDSGFHKGVIK
jgi:hypothetical protein